MNEINPTIQISAATVDEAIEKGLDQLGVPRDAVNVEILEDAKTGFLGMGNREVKVQLTVQSLEESRQKKPIGSIKRNGSEDLEYDDPVENARVLADEIINDILNMMKIKAEVKSRIKEPEDENDRAMVLIDVSGKDLSILIGRKAETLNSLQYITSLVLNQKVGDWVPMMIDVQGYRHRRERQLRQLARRLADQVVQTGRRQVMEPMPANERRLIHLELRYHPFVTTESIGDGANRKATIFLKPRE